MEDEVVCKRTLEEILQIKINKIEYANMEKVVEVDSNARGTRMDLYVEDGEKSIYDIEIQTSDKKDLGKGMRYYQAIMDVNHLQKNASFKALNKSYIIFICTYDEFKDGYCKHEFQNRCMRNPELILKDDAYKIVLTTIGDLEDVSDELRGFLKFVKNSTEDTLKEYPSKLAKLVARKMKEVKENTTMQIAYMRDNLRLYDAREEGAHEKARETAKNLLHRFPDKEIAEIVGLPIEEVKEIRKETEVYHKNIEMENRE